LLRHVLVDGTTVTLNGFANPDVENQILFSAAHLTHGLHNFQVVNAGNANGTKAFFDIDYLLWESQVQDGTATQIIDNTNPRFTYLPVPTVWGGAEGGTASFNDTLTTTTSPIGRVRLDFVGTTVALYGTLGPSHGHYSCSIDGGNPKVYSGTFPSLITQQVLCFGDSLAPGRHSLTVKNIPTGKSTKALSIDYARIWSAKKRGPGPWDWKSADHSDTRTSRSGAKISEAVIACLAVAIGLILLYLFWYRRRRWRQKRKDPVPKRRPAQMQPEDGIHVSRSITVPQEHIVPFVISPEANGQTAFEAPAPTAHRGTSLNSDAKGSTRSDSTSTERTRRSRQSSEPPPSPDSRTSIVPMPTNVEAPRRPLRVVSRGASGKGPRTSRGAPRRPVKILPTLSARPLQRSETVRYIDVIQEEDGGEINETTVTPLRVPPAYSRIPPR